MDGLLPVPGDGRSEWQGFHRAGELPYCLNPDSGPTARANEQNVPPDCPLPAEIGHEWTETARAARLAELLASTRAHTVASSYAL
jgi:penicillin G amidase